MTIDQSGYVPDRPLSEEEFSLLQSKLWDLLGRRADEYVRGDSSSLPVETAQELFTSICFTLDAALKGNGKPQSFLLTANLDSLLSLGQKLIENRIGLSKQLWQTACSEAPQLDNRSLHDTLRSLGGFAANYDYLFFAHHVPADIDYQLCQAVPDSQQGVDYVIEYLRRLIIENRVLRSFDEKKEHALLHRFCPDPHGLLINLCEPVLTNALGLELIGGDVAQLEITAAELEQLTELLRPLSDEETRQHMAAAVAALCRDLHISDVYARNYLSQLAVDLTPRVLAALPTGLEKLFLAF